LNVAIQKRVLKLVMLLEVGNRFRFIEGHILKDKSDSEDKGVRSYYNRRGSIFQFCGRGFNQTL